MRLTNIIALFGALLCAGSTLQAATLGGEINDLYNTGMSTPWNSATQTPLAGSDSPAGTANKVTDPHWTVDAPGTSRDGQAATLSEGTGKFSGPLALQDQLAYGGVNQVSDSQWITSPNYPATTPLTPNPNPAGLYVYTTTFTTTASLATIDISGFLRAPSGTISYQLNGGPIVSLGVRPANGTPSTSPQGFNITGTGGLTNTLKFYYQQPASFTSNFAGIRIQFSSATFTPEPSSFVLGALGLFGLGVFQARRRRTTALRQN